MTKLTQITIHRSKHYDYIDSSDGVSYHLDPQETQVARHAIGAITATQFKSVPYMTITAPSGGYFALCRSVYDEPLIDIVDKNGHTETFEVDELALTAQYYGCKVKKIK